MVPRSAVRATVTAGGSSGPFEQVFVGLLVLPELLDECVQVVLGVADAVERVLLH